jgi:enoyl-[acyl-carrier protein] reductase I
VSFLDLENKTFLVVGVANRKSVAWSVAKLLKSEGANILYCVRSAKRRDELSELLGKSEKIFTCDFEKESEISELEKILAAQENLKLDGILHSIAFANYSEGVRPFHETKRRDFLQATQISSFSLVELSRICKPFLKESASVVTIGISSTDVTAENYGYMAPIKASLEASVRYLAKSFSSDSAVRFNSVNAGPLKTSASAGIPGYLVNYLYAEKLTFRKKALETQEVANLAAFLLSSKSSGINGQGIVIDAGMGLNYFDQEIVQDTMRVKS